MRDTVGDDHDLAVDGSDIGNSKREAMSIIWKRVERTRVLIDEPDGHKEETHTAMMICLVFVHSR